MDCFPVNLHANSEKWSLSWKSFRWVWGWTSSNFKTTLKCFACRVFLFVCLFLLWSRRYVYMSRSMHVKSCTIEETALNSEMTASKSYISAGLPYRSGERHHKIECTVWCWLYQFRGGWEPRELLVSHNSISMDPLNVWNMCKLHNIPSPNPGNDYLKYFG